MTFRTLLFRVLRFARRLVGLPNSLGLLFFEQLLFSGSIRLQDRALRMDTGRGIGRLSTNGARSPLDFGIRWEWFFFAHGSYFHFQLDCRQAADRYPREFPQMQQHFIQTKIPVFIWNSEIPNALSDPARIQRRCDSVRHISRYTDTASTETPAHQQRTNRRTSATNRTRVDNHRRLSSRKTVRRSKATIKGLVRPSRLRRSPSDRIRGGIKRQVSLFTLHFGVESTFHATAEQGRQRLDKVITTMTSPQ